MKKELETAYKKLEESVTNKRKLSKLEQSAYDDMNKELRESNYTHPNEGVKLPEEKWKHSKKKYYQSTQGYYFSAGVIFILALILIITKTILGVIIGLGLIFWGLVTIPTNISTWQRYEESDNQNPNDNIKIF